MYDKVRSCSKTLRVHVCFPPAPFCQPAVGREHVVNRTSQSVLASSKRGKAGEDKELRTCKPTALMFDLERAPVRGEERQEEGQQKGVRITELGVGS